MTVTSREKAEETELVKMLCDDTAQFRMRYFEKLRAGWKSLNLEEEKPMLHYLYRIFFTIKSEQEKKIFEWHNFFDIHHDFPMRAHLDNGEDHRKCATMADIVGWFKRSEKERDLLRQIGKAPKLIYCIGRQTNHEQGYLNQVDHTVENPLNVAAVIRPVSSIAAKCLGMSKLDTADVTVFNDPSRLLSAKSAISLPLRHSASALLFPVTDMLERQFKKDFESWKTHLPRTLDDPSVPIKGGSFDKTPRRKNGVTEMPVLLPRKVAGHWRYEKLLTSEVWKKVDDETKATLLENQIRQRFLLFDDIISGWKTAKEQNENLSEWLYRDVVAPLHTRRFSTFEYYHFVPSHSYSISTKSFYPF
ncbi:unnamed protein product [Caenorhabditis sp. 36 PRJEB53466]|nr:unnamed protein product [Caenorhabditis sp. 36 PRJEB53466]